MKTAFFRALTLIFMLITQIVGFAYDFSDSGIRFNILSTEDRTVEVTYVYHNDEHGFNGDYYSYGIYIPETVYYNNTIYTVTAIGDYAFSCCDRLTSVAIPSTVTSIGKAAFSNCLQLTEISIPSSVYAIGGGAFSACLSLERVTIGYTPNLRPNLAAKISFGGGVFDCCGVLKSVMIDPEHPYYSYINGIIYNKNVTSLLACIKERETITIPNSVIVIGDSAFFKCSGIESITIPNSVTVIGDGAFYGCRIESITIPSSVQKIGEEAFLIYSLENIYVDVENKNYTSVDGVLYDKKVSTLLTCPCAKSSLTIPGTVTSIADNAIKCCALESISIPNSVASIGRNNLYECGVESLIIPGSVTSIGDGSFAYCDCLTALYVQSKVPVKFNAGFNRSNWLNANKNRYSIVHVYVPTGTLSAYKQVEPWSKFKYIQEMDFSGIEDAEMDATRGTGEPVIRVENGVIKVDNADGEAPVEVFDISGKSVFRECANMVSGLAKGIYIVKVGDKVQKIRL